MNPLVFATLSDYLSWDQIEATSYSLVGGSPTSWTRALVIDTDGRGETNTIRDC